MFETHEGPATLTEIRSPNQLSGEILSSQIEQYHQTPGNSSRPLNDADAGNVINNALDPSALYGSTIAARDTRAPEVAQNTGNQANPPTLEEALRWAKTNMHRLDENHDGGMSKWEIGLANLGERLSPQDQQMAKVLMDNYEILKLSNIDKFKTSKNGPEGFDAISVKDIDKRLGRIELDHRLEETSRESTSAARQLMKGEPPLFEFLDQASNGKTDGKISKGDLEKYLRNSRFFPGEDSGPYSSQNVQLVSRLLDTWDQGAFPGPGTALRGIRTPKDFADSLNPMKDHDKFKFITHESLARAAGLA
jgi:hypothetical protein